MPAILVKIPNCEESGKGKIPEYLMLELQGDLECRITEELQDCSGKFVGDLLFNKYGHPILIVGHHILFGKTQNMEKPFALIEKIPQAESMEVDGEDAEEPVIVPKFDSSLVPDDTVPNASFSILDTTVQIEHRTKPKVEYHVKAFIKKKIIFNQRPRPIVSNVPKSN